MTGISAFLEILSGLLDIFIRWLDTAEERRRSSEIKSFKEAVASGDIDTVNLLLSRLQTESGVSSPIRLYDKEGRPIAN